MTIDEAFRAALRDEIRAVVRDEVRAAVTEIAAAPLTKGEYLSVKTAAAVAGVHQDTIRAWVKAGRLPEHRAGRELRIRRDELHRFLDAGAAGEARQSPEAEAAAILSKRRR